MSNRELRDETYSTSPQGPVIGETSFEGGARPYCRKRSSLRPKYTNENLRFSQIVFALYIHYITCIGKLLLCYLIIIQIHTSTILDRNLPARIPVFEYTDFTI